MIFIMQKRMMRSQGAVAAGLGALGALAGLTGLAALAGLGALIAPSAVGATATTGAAVASGVNLHAATAYVANARSDTVTPIDTASGTPGKPIRVGVQPVDIAITPSGATAYVSAFTGSAPRATG